MVRFAWIWKAAALVLAAISLAACSAVPISPSDTPSALDPRGPGAAKVAELWWVMFGFGLLVFILVVALLVAALLRRRRASEDTVPQGNGDVGRRWVVWGGIALPLVIIAIVFGYSIHTLAAIGNPSDEHDLKIEVIGRRWWWEVRYTEQGFNTANELHIPVGVPVEIELHSGDIIHSFWVPQLHGKMDAIPTRINRLTIQADVPGIYRGECAEFCGFQHAHMGFMVVAESQADYDAWVEAQQQPAAPPDGEMPIRGQQVFLQQGCAHCHPVRGLDDNAVDASEVDLAPDLTHLYSRLTIAGATLTNSRGNLAGWIVDSQHVKPGNLMPPMYLESEDLQALLAYLETLT